MDMFTAAKQIRPLTRGARTAASIALAPVLALLISSGFGSLSTQRIQPGAEGRALAKSLLWVLALLAISDFAVPPILRQFVGAPTPAKAMASVALIAPLGFVVSTEIGTFTARAIRFSTGRILASSCSSGTSSAPGRVDSPPTSMRSAP